MSSTERKSSRGCSRRVGIEVAQEWNESTSNEHRQDKNINKKLVERRSKAPKRLNRNKSKPDDRFNKHLNDRGTKVEKARSSKPVGGVGRKRKASSSEVRVNRAQYPSQNSSLTNQPVTRRDPVVSTNPSTSSHGMTSLFLSLLGSQAKCNDV